MKLTPWPDTDPPLTVKAPTAGVRTAVATAAAALKPIAPLTPLPLAVEVTFAEAQKATRPDPPAAPAWSPR